MSFTTFFKNKKILITGHSGFKGSWLVLFLKTLGTTNVLGFSLMPKTPDDLFYVSQIDNYCQSVFHDIKDFNYLVKVVGEYQPDIVFHLAAQPLVRYSYINPIETYQTNVLGTVNVMESLKKINKKCAVVIITTDKVYENREWNYPYREVDRLGGKDPYSSSKACAELVVSSFRNSFFPINKISEHNKAIATARAGNVIGGGDWSEDRLIPDIVRAIREDREIVIRNPEAVRPWQNVLEPLYGYLLLAYKLYNNPSDFTGEWNFGPYPQQVLKVEDVVELAIQTLNKGNYIIKRDKNAPHEATLLRLDISKVLSRLNWHPVLTTRQSIEWTLNWYNEYLTTNNNSMIDYSSGQIDNFLKRIL